MKLRTYLFALVLAALPISAAAQSPEAADDATGAEQNGETFQVPRFRHVEPDPPEIDLNPVRLVRFLTDSSFPPFSYTSANGSLTGLNVAIADAICNDLRLKCEFIVKPWNELLPALREGKGDAILSGVAITEEGFKTLDFTKPFLRSTGRFAVRVENPIAKAAPRSLAGKRIGVLTGSAHEAFLQTHFKRSKLLPFDKSADAREALRTGSVDALFGDGFQLLFWVHGATSKECCRLADGAYFDRVHLDFPMTIAVKRGNGRLRDVLDLGLDRLQDSGQFARLYRSFFPGSIW